MINLHLHNSFCKFTTESRTLIDQLSELLSYTNKSADYAHAKTLGAISYYNKLVKRETNEDVVSKYRAKLRQLLFNLEELERERVVKLLDTRKKEFPAGLLPRVLDFLDERKIYFELEDKRVNNSVNNGLKLIKPIPPLRYYQEEAWPLAVAGERGVLEMATGAGKTNIIVKILSELRVNSIVVTPSLDITTGVYETLCHYFGEKQVSLLKGKTPKLSKINVVNIQSFAKMDADLFKDQHAVLIDEFHHSGSISYFEANSKQLRSCYYRFGLTATNFRNSGDGMALEGVLSNTLYRYPAIQAIKDGFLTPPEMKWIYNNVKNIELEEPLPSLKPEKKVAAPVKGKKKTKKKAVKKKASKKGYQLEYDEGIVRNRSRNLEIAEIAEKHRKDSVIVLVQHVDHGRYILKQIDWAQLITGSETKEERDRMLNDFRAGKIRCLIGTSVLGEGVDLPIANVLILAGGGKSKIQYMQNIGRVLRLFKGKTKALVYDFRDEGSKYLSVHAEERAAIYREVYGE